MSDPRVLEVLVVNDDGIDAPGLRELARLASGLGRVTVVAPAEHRSGAAHSITVKWPREVAPRPDVWPDDEAGAHRAFSLDGTPADCTLLGLQLLAPRGVGLVLSGVNDGLNAGYDVTRSGTVGAAMEAALRGVPAVAFSQSKACADFEALELAFRWAMAWLLAPGGAGADQPERPGGLGRAGAPEGLEGSSARDGSSLLQQSAATGPAGSCDPDDLVGSSQASLVAGPAGFLGPARAPLDPLPEGVPAGSRLARPGGVWNVNCPAVHAGKLRGARFGVRPAAAELVPTGGFERVEQPEGDAACRPGGAFLVRPLISRRAVADSGDEFSRVSAPALERRLGRPGALPDLDGTDLGALKSGCVSVGWVACPVG